VTLGDVVRSIAERAINAPSIAEVDERLCRVIRLVEQHLRQHGVRRILKARIAEGVTLGWSARRGAWRLVIVDDAGAEPLLDVEPEERIEVFTSGAITELLTSRRQP
jgi:hypothetical protein